MSDVTAAELALEALLESRLEIIAARLQALTPSTKLLHSEAQASFKEIQAKYRRLQIIEDYLLRLQGKPGLSHLYTDAGAPPRRYVGIGSSEIEEIKMGVKTLRRKFQAAGVAVSTVGWWRHLKEKDVASPVAIVAVEDLSNSTHGNNKTHDNTATPVAAAAEEEAPVASDKSAASSPAAKLSIDTSIAMPAVSKKAAPLLSPKAVLSPTSSSNKKRNTLALQQIFTPLTATKPLHEHFATSPSSQRAHPSLGLFSPPMSPFGPGGDPATAENSLARGLSLHS
ncbi:hypothetical protein BGZ70_003250 [Mortierella alpina]|uniref:Uncharacterized protein n=1 Tax=Mortierella alpina TaxID=64518 RepID=A0A9P6JD03_MORAP|nr:hypothetical protein BGZ70_003250 [Mortierella alpina]